jgi:hypothetical protein
VALHLGYGLYPAWIHGSDTFVAHGSRTHKLTNPTMSCAYPRDASALATLALAAHQSGGAR